MRVRISTHPANHDSTLQKIVKAYSEDKAVNMPAPVDDQCQCLREIGYADVDCFFRII